jgi:hypothetical protein
MIKGTVSRDILPSLMHEGHERFLSCKIITILLSLLPEICQFITLVFVLAKNLYTVGF